MKYPMPRFLLVGLLISILGACGKNSEAELLAEGKSLLAKKDFAGAAIQLKNAVAKNPDSPAARLLLGQALLRGGDPAAALVELRKAQEAQASDEQVVPDIARAMLDAGEGAKLLAQYRDTVLGHAGATADLKTSLAMAYTAQGNLSQARAVAAAALQAQPGHAPATVLLARLDASEGNVPGALSQLDEVLARDAGNAEAGLLKGEILSRTGKDGDAALEALRKVRSAHPDLVAAHAAVINTRLQRAQRAEARADFEQLRKLAPRHPETLFLQAQFAFEDKDYKLCRELTQQLLVIKPDNVLVLVLAGGAEYRLQHYTLAEGLLGQALKQAPKLLLTRHLLAQTYLRDALPDKAVEVLLPVIESPAADAASLALAGEAYLQAGDGKRSEAAFRRALKAAPEDAGLGTSVALAQLARGDTGAATAQLEAIAKGDQGVQADMALVSARLSRKDFKGALLALDAVLHKQPDQAYPLTLRGRVLVLQDDTAGAVASFEKALVKTPNYLPAITTLAAIDIKAGKPEQARQRFESLIKAEPKNVRARLALADLDAELGASPALVVAQLRAAAKADASLALPHLALIERLLGSADGKGALAAAQEASAALPTDLAVMESLGRAQIAAGDGQQAVSTFKKLTALQPGKARHQVQLADAFIASRDTSAAAKALRQALTIEPDNLMAQRGLAMLAVMDKRPQEGIAIARALQQRLPQDAAGFALEGELEAMGKNWGAAAAAYAAALQRSRSSDFAIRQHRFLRSAGKAAEADGVAADWIKGNPKDAAFVYYLGDMALAAKDWPRAEAQYRAVMALQPHHAMAINNVAWLLATQRKPGATAMAERAVALLPERAALLDTLALALEVENQLPKAVETQRRAVQLDPKDPTLRLRLAQLLIKHGNKSEARNELETLGRLGGGFAGQSEVATLLMGL